MLFIDKIALLPHSANDLPAIGGGRRIVMDSHDKNGNGSHERIPLCIVANSSVESIVNRLNSFTSGNYFIRDITTDVWADVVSLLGA